MNNQEITDLMRGMLKNKSSVLEAVAKSIDDSTRIEKGLRKVMDSVLENPNEDNLRKQLHVTMKSLASQSKTINQLALICLVYAASGDFTSDVAKTLSKLGHGKEALQEMFRQKINGGI